MLHIVHSMSDRCHACAATEQSYTSSSPCQKSTGTETEITFLIIPLNAARARCRALQALRPMRRLSLRNAWNQHAVVRWSRSAALWRTARLHSYSNHIVMWPQVIKLKFPSSPSTGSVFPLPPPGVGEKLELPATLLYTRLLNTYGVLSRSTDLILSIDHNVKKNVVKRFLLYKNSSVTLGKTSRWRCDHQKKKKKIQRSQSAKQTFKNTLSS